MLGGITSIAVQGDRLVVTGGAVLELDDPQAVGPRERVPPLEVSLDWVMGGCGVRFMSRVFPFFRQGDADSSTDS